MNSRLSNSPVPHRQPELIPGREARWRSVTWILAGVLLSVAVGLAVARVPYLLVFGAVGALAGLYLVLRWPFVGLLLYTILFMWRPGETYPVLSALRLERVIGIVTLTAMLIDRYRRTGALALDNSKSSRVLLFITLTVAASIPLAYYRSAAVDGLINFLKLAVWYLLVVHLLTTSLRLRVYLAVYLVAITKLAADALRAYFSGNYMYAQGVERVVGQTDAAGDPNALAATCAATIPLMILLSVNSRMRIYRLLPLLGTTLLVVTVALSGSRSGLLAMLIGSAVLLRRVRHTALVAGLAIVFVLGGFMALPEEYQTRYSGIVSSERDASSQGRITAWKKGLQMIADRPVLGVGVSCFPVANAMAYSEDGARSWLQPHSIYVQIPSEIGLVGAFLFFLWVATTVRFCLSGGTGSVRGPDSQDLEKNILFGLGAGLVALLVAGLFGHSFMRYTWYVYGALAVAIGRRDFQQPEVPERFPSRDSNAS